MKRRIVIIIGSTSDLPQCRRGLELLKSYGHLVDVVGVYVRSQHRNTESTQQLLMELSRQKIDAAIIGAGWANHLTGCCDAYLRYHLHSADFPVIGVAFEDPKNCKHTEAALLSMTEVPGTKVVYQEDGAPFVGPGGFLRACEFAVMKPLPKITLPEPKKIWDGSLEEALELANQES